MQERIDFTGFRQVVPFLIAFGLIQNDVVFGMGQHGIERGQFGAGKRLAGAVFGPHAEEKLANLVAAGIEHGRDSGGFRWLAGEMQGGNFALVLAQVGNDALAAFRLARLADIAPEQDQPVVGVDAEFLRNGLEQLLFHFQHGFARRQPGAVGDPEDMRVDRHRRLAESGVQNDVCGLAAHARQGFERGALGGNLAVVQIDQHFAGGDEVPGLAFVETDGLDGVGQPGFTQREHGLGGVGSWKQPARGQVHALVGGLRRERDRHQQFERRAVFEFGRGMRVGRAQAAEDFVAFGWIHEADFKRSTLRCFSRVLRACFGNEDFTQARSRARGDSRGRAVVRGPSASCARRSAGPAR